jgi:hypothetical protein
MIHAACKTSDVGRPDTEGREMEMAEEGTWTWRLAKARLRGGVKLDRARA